MALVRVYFTRCGMHRTSAKRPVSTQILPPAATSRHVWTCEPLLAAPLHGQGSFGFAVTLMLHVVPHTPSTFTRAWTSAHCDRALHAHAGGVQSAPQRTERC
jgi:hypothetical protein